MPDITETQVREFIALKLADESDILATEHREVENKMMDFIVQELAKTVKSKVVTLDSFTTDRNYSVATDLALPSVITGVLVMLVCAAANNGFAVGDTITAPTPYPQDANRTSAQGIGVQFNNSNPGSVKVMVNDQITIMTAYNSGTGAVANNVMLSGGSMANWAIKLIIGYI
ncbi:hypothetical protein D3C85_538430 [compost metagenome]